MADTLVLAENQSVKGEAMASGKEVLDAWAYSSLFLELLVYKAEPFLMVGLETAMSLDDEHGWHLLGYFTPMPSGKDSRGFGPLMRYVRWRAFAGDETGEAVFTLRGVAR